MQPTVLALPGNDALAARLTLELAARRGRLDVRRFPDGESYVRVRGSIAGRPVVIAATLDRPDEKLLPLMLAAATAREIGATSVGLVAPYLPYLRQDRRFRSGEAVSARHFAGFVSQSVDWVVTVDPHLHRLHALGEVYPIPTESITAAPRLAQWVREHIPRPFLIGPDEESRQWVERVASAAGAPWVVFRKRRLGDATVTEDLPDLRGCRDRIPVLVDDIVSTAATMIESAHALTGMGLAAPYCVAVHGIFAGSAFARLSAAGVARVVTCNTITHSTNAIDIHDLLAAAARRRLEGVETTMGSRSW